ncbi:FHA domain-containing protein [Jatrophihabitans telluris]|uniref:FHA domain-containing protein n=1 Tax=Jatrophihabitans telluris TaxID=2038343 RepID=A0ABY4QZH2_9ACTN|nr:DUF3662 and FHA domain-containing protein [Jatrophihabitans telluris]UQX88627.1 FHA domain-containing protein [Jatrophihabitans telluris]
MSLGQRFERRLEGMVGSAFARVFKGQVEPVEIGSALQREASDKRAVMGTGQVLSPNRYRVTLGPSDYDRLAPWEAQLTRSLAELIQEHLDENGLGTVGDIEVYLAQDNSLHTGVFGVASRMEPQAPPRRRPYDSMSMPVVPGRPDEYVEPFGTPAAPASDNAAEHAARQAPPLQPEAPGYLAPPYPPPGYQPAHQPPQPPAYQPPAYQPPAYQPPPHQPPPHQPPAYQPPPAPPPAPAPYVEPPRRPRFQAQLIVDETGQNSPLHPGSNIVGRGHDSDLQLLDQGVSRRHIDIHVADGRAVLYDLGSTNGTSVNGHSVQSQQLQHGDVIRIGHSRLVYQQDGA